MKILIVSATKDEIIGVFSNKNLVQNKQMPNLYESEKTDILISGIGTTYTAFNLTNILNKNLYKSVINIGIAGAYNRNLKIGQVVVVKQDTFADLGIDDNGSFKTLDEMGLSKQINSWNLKEEFIKLSYKKVNSITVNTASGSNEIINILKKTFNPDIETMEGAAVYFVCNEMNIPVIQIRAISNYIEPRNKSNWDIKKAIKSLEEFINIYKFI
jgi:futalosine hydrolase